MEITARSLAGLAPVAIATATVVPVVVVVVVAVVVAVKEAGSEDVRDVHFYPSYGYIL
ncbi:MAG: hypothetical protein ACRDS0_31125 [Pseudonocardiaceae bacterium]